MKFTVIIPTFNRPNLLKVALQSVASQTAIGMIDKVVVSENGLNRESESTCLLFNEINIEYIYQEKQLPVSKHLQWIMSLEQENHVAFLCDDDWWDVNHLELAARHLKEKSNCHAYFSNFTYAQDEQSIKFSLYSGLRGIHLGKVNYANYLPCVYSKSDLFKYSFIITPFHFSALVCRGDILSESVTIFDYIHPTYADRALWPIIATMTDVVFNPLATTLVRFHDEMDSHRYSSIEWRIEAQKGSLFILEAADKQGYNLKEAINQLYHYSTGNDKDFLLDNISWVFMDRQYITWFAGFEKIMMRDAAQKSYKYRAKSFLDRIYRKTINKVF